MSARPRSWASVMDVGGTHVTAARVDTATRSVLPGSMVCEPLDSDGTAEEILATLVRCGSRLPEPSDGRWVVAIPGPFDYARGIGGFEGVGKFEALRGVDVGAALVAALPGAAEISFLNDAEAFLLGEWWAGAAQGHDYAMAITLGTGVGSSFLRNARVVVDGPGVPAEGRVDLLRYRGRPLEETVSRHALRRGYAEAAGDSSPIDVREIAQRARQGDVAAAAVFARVFHALGTVLAPVASAFEPTILVVGGSIAGSWDLVGEALRAGLAEADAAVAERVGIERAVYLREAPLLGAAYWSLSTRLSDD